MRAMPSATPPFDRAIALACTMRTLRGRRLYVRCACLASNSRPVRLILRNDPAASRRTLADVVVHLRCHACDARQASVHLTETPLPPDVKGDVVPGWCLLLHGTEENTSPLGT
jgi:hypothetical protein